MALLTRLFKHLAQPLLVARDVREIGGEVEQEAMVLGLDAEALDHALGQLRAAARRPSPA